LLGLGENVLPSQELQNESFYSLPHSPNRYPNPIGESAFEPISDSELALENYLTPSKSITKTSVLPERA
jgi:hypothetical protein